MSTTDLTDLSRSAADRRRSAKSTAAKVFGGQQFFEFDAPEAFISPQLFAVNPRGDMIYSVKIDMKLALDPDTHEVVILLGNRTVCRCSIHSGTSISYMIDDDITANELRESNDFYLLSDNIAVLITYNPENYHLSQYVLVLSDTDEKAVLTMKRRMTLPTLNSGLTIGTGLLDVGIVLATGYTGPEGENRQVVAYLLAADPLKASAFPNKDITSIVRQFEQFLMRHDPDLHVFAPGILAERTGLIFLLKSSDYEMLETTIAGRVTFSSNGADVLCELIPLDNTSVLFPRLLCVRHLRQVCHGKDNIWMTIISSDFEQLNSWKWRFYLSSLLYIIKLITVVLRFVLWMRRIDRGISLYLYMRLLRWLYGPSMIPVTAPPPKFTMYGLDMKSYKFRRVPIEPELYSVDNTFVGYPLAIDCDKSGGVVTAELRSTLKVNYFPNQNRPPRLCKLAEYSVYRHYPAFEKSPLLRRSVGLLNWENV